MFNLKYLYDHHSVRILIEGLPDLSIGNNNNHIGILSSWKLEIAGYPELEGKLEHLQKFIEVIYPYTRCYLSGINQEFRDLSSPISIESTKDGHLLTLRSSKKEIEPLTIILDDAELSDVVVCLDKFRQDERVKLPLNYSNKYNNIRKSIVNKKLKAYQLLSPALGLLSVIIFSFIFILIPNEQRFKDINNNINLDVNLIKSDDPN
tara:strand:- start:3875 stop:4492 length:618 start_codon:yes stop_codon:yes gene_type:complete